ncbi:winged helix-turn-helix domain-containing protein [Brachybacterium sp. NBEC-018]|uniref:ArsR/SmtB family transcription factor n=1 Tax=Brachybacterium sp. NBEC-018 TaxID=2996004 RepID=UPI00217523EE|nr:winged helix-turn-helix domain-containing protein [Brachybacterium sp. NBEC-018]UVY84346.1 winged helix-turn-helix domain-containing protein [Brachybacterium sp. NBEC-018]
MLETSPDRADAWFHALADRTRRDILRRVMDGEQSVSALARNYAMSTTAVQKHVGVLERAGLITRRRRGRETLARADAEELRSAAQLITELEQHWRERVDRIDALLAADPAPRRASATVDSQPGPLQED